MYKALFLSVLCFFTAFTVSAQQPVSIKKDSVVVNSKKLTDTVINSASRTTDTLKKPYVNLGKIAGRRALFSSLIVPGLGQIRNGITVYRLAKVAGIYVGATFLGISYVDNTKNYHIFLKEVQYRNSDPNGESPEGSIYASYPTEGLIAAKDTFRRNREVVIFSFVGLYLLNAIEAYIDARLKYFDVSDIGMKLSPDVINTDTMYGFNQITPGIKLTFRL